MEEMNYQDVASGVDQKQQKNGWGRAIVIIVAIVVVVFLVLMAIGRQARNGDSLLGEKEKREIRGYLNQEVEPLSDEEKNGIRTTLEEEIIYE